MRVSTLGQNLLIRQQVQKLQAEMADLQWQQTSGKKAKTFGGIADNSAVLLNLRNRVSTIGQFENSLSTTLMRTSVMQDALGRVATAAQDISVHAITSTDVNPELLRRLPAASQSALGEAVSRLQTQLGDRFLFSGESRTAAPVAEADQILSSVDGLPKLIADRRAADLGAGSDGYVQSSVGGTTLTIEKTLAAGDATYTAASYGEFGFTLVSASYNSTAAAATAYVPGTTNASLSLNIPAVNPGDTFTMTVALPGGEQKEIRLVFTSDPAVAARDPNTILLNPATALSDLSARINEEIRKAAARELAVASTMKAAEFMFDYSDDPAAAGNNPVPRYVADNGAGNPVVAWDSAGTQVRRWYAGQTWPLNTGSRESAQVQADDRTTVSYGVRADEAPLRDTVKLLAVLAATDGDTFPSEDGYKDLVSRAGLALSAAHDGVIDIGAELGHTEEQLQRLADKHAKTKELVSQRVLEIEQSDPYLVSSRILEIETKLRGSYEVSSRIYSLSLVNYLK